MKHIYNKVIPVVWLLATLTWVIATTTSQAQEWQTITWQGRVSTVELACKEIGLQLAPWGIDGSSVRCINDDLMDKDDGVKGPNWAPSSTNWMHGYCGFYHGTSMEHYEQDTFIFWCVLSPATSKQGA